MPKFTITNTISFSILLIPMWWFLGIGSVIFQFLTLILFLSLLLTRGNQLSFPTKILSLLLFIVVYLLAIITHINTIPFPRLIASLNNLSLWIQGFILIVVIYNSSMNEINTQAIIKSIVVFGTTCGFIALVGLFLWFSGVDGYSLRSPLYSFIPQNISQNIFGSSFALSIISFDYTSLGVLPRTSSFFSYPTALGMGMVITIPFSVYYFRSRRESKSIKAMTSITLQIIAFTLSLSRISLIAFFCALAFVVIMTSSINYRTISIYLLIMIVLICSFPLFYQFFYKLKQGSTTLRYSMYKETFKQTLKEPILGYGYKPRSENAPIPFASHSTLFSTMYKTGFLGLSLLSLFYMHVLRMWISICHSKASNHLIRYLGVIFIAGILWQLTEDLDAPVIVAYLYFIVIALIISFHKTRRTSILLSPDIGKQP